MISRRFKGDSNEPSINLARLGKGDAVENPLRCRSGEEPEIKFHTISKISGIEIIETVRAKDFSPP